MAMVEGGDSAYYDRTGDTGLLSGSHGGVVKAVEDLLARLIPADELSSRGTSGHS
jgi:hypothetical protein